MTPLGPALVGFAAAFGVYTYILYPAILWTMARLRPRAPLPSPADVTDWPTVTVTVPAYNEEVQIGAAIEALLRLDYPQDRIRILVVSDASTDRTDEIVRSFADRGVELLRQPIRAGKTAAEKLASRHITSELVVNTDASIRIPAGSLKPLIAPFVDPRIGLASGRDISVGADQDTNRGEGGYVGYEMWVRDLETRVRGIVGASGSFYAIRRETHLIDLPDSLSRDFAAAMDTWEVGLRPVSVPNATAIVPRVGSLKREYRRKVRTITRGIETLWHRRVMLNPLEFGLYAWMLFSHKVCRWALPWIALFGVVGLGLMARDSTLAGVVLGLVAALVALGAGSWLIAGDRRLPPLLAVAGFLVMGNVASMVAGVRALQGDRNALWEPTRRHPH